MEISRKFESRDFGIHFKQIPGSRSYLIKALKISKSIQHIRGIVRQYSGLIYIIEFLLSRRANSLKEYVDSINFQIKYGSNMAVFKQKWPFFTSRDPEVKSRDFGMTQTPPDPGISGSRESRFQRLPCTYALS